MKLSHENTRAEVNEWSHISVSPTNLRGLGRVNLTFYRIYIYIYINQSSFPSV